MTKTSFLLKMNWRLIPIKRTRRGEIVNHYRAIIDQSMSNGNTEESAVESLGSVNSLCRLVLKKEHKPCIVPWIATFFHFLFVIIAAVVLVACIAALLGIVGALVYAGYLLVTLMMNSLIPSMAMFSADIFAGLFRLGACMIVAAVLIVLLLLAKTVLIWAVKVFLFIIKKIRNAIYRAQSTKLMKGAFRNEAIN